MAEISTFNRLKAQMKCHKDNKTPLAWLCYVAFLLLFCTHLSHAHPMSSTQVEVNVLDDVILLTLRLPNNRLGAALGTAPTTHNLQGYVLENVNVHLHSDKGNKWPLKITKVVEPDSHNYWQVDVTVTPLIGESHTSFDIDYSVITERIITHKAKFWLMPQGASKDLPQFLGTLRGKQTHLSVGGGS